MDTITSAVNKSIFDSITIYTNTLIDNGLLNCDFDTAISHFSITTNKKKKSNKPDVIKSLPMWTPHHFDTCIALVGDCMAQCSLSKTQGQFCTACSKKCGEDGIPPNGTIFMRDSYQYTAPNGKSPKPFIESTIYKKKIKDGESPAQIKQYYDDLHFDISPLNWGKGASPPLDPPKKGGKAPLKPPQDNSDGDEPKATKKGVKPPQEDSDEDEPVTKKGAASVPPKNASDDEESDQSDHDEEESTKKPNKKPNKEPTEKPNDKPTKKPTEKPDTKNAVKTSAKMSVKSAVKTDVNFTEELIPDIPDSVEWSFQGHDYLAVNLPGGDKNIYDSISHEHIGIFNSRSKRLIKY